jgi:hypothetical protein
MHDMSLAVSVHLDHPDAPIEAGHDVRGHVDLASDTGVEVRGLTLEVGWRTEGSGNPATGITTELDLLPVPTRLRRGEKRAVRFRFEAPPGPLTYDGKHLRVVNFLRASADIRWARDPAADLVYELRPSRDQVKGFQGPMLQLSEVPAGPARVRAKPRPSELTIAAGLLFVAMGAALVAGTAGVAPHLLTLTIAAGAVALAAALVLPFRSRIAERRLGRVDLVLDQAVVVPGDTIRVAVSFEPRAHLRIQGITAALRGREQVVRGGGRSQSVHQHRFNHVEAALAGAMSPERGQRMALWTSLSVAPGCPCSFRARSNRLDWEVEVRIAIAGWPDWVVVQPVMIVPARVAVTAGRG